MKKLIIMWTIFISACASINGQEEKPLIYEDQIVGDHARLASCIMKRLQSESRWAFRLLQFNNRIYQDIEASEIYAFDMRFLPGIYARNSPTNPDAVLDYAGPNPEIRSYEDRRPGNELPHAFAVMIKQIDDMSVTVALRGERYRGEIAWKHVQACASFRKIGAVNSPVAA